ncbi:MAG: AAA family ATPase [Clostridia bacterium]|nr:AAA family ATPase [Clostridia bacterium]
MKYGLIGEKLGHSFSPEIHHKLGRYDYRLREIAKTDLPAFLTARDFAGINVTIPYKTDVIPYLDELSELAREIGAVNTVVCRDGKLYGDNTDVHGMISLIRRITPDLAGKTVLILGTGGTSRAAVAAATALGAKKTVRVSRTGRDGAVTYEDAYRDFADADFLINTTPVGMFPHAGVSPVDLSRFPRLAGVADAIYNPLSTRLLLDAKALGIPAENGLYMLVAQAMKSAELFTGEPVGENETERIWRELLFEKRNIVLIGMPGSGKSTVGRGLADRLGRNLIDTDDLIVRRAGKPVTEIFASQGETAFRDLESSVIREVSASGGAIVSTGGGAILRQENVDALRSNGVSVYLDRPLEDLVPTSDRPLADEIGKIRLLYEKRAPLYRAAADLTVPVRETPEDVINEVLEKLK